METYVVVIVDVIFALIAAVFVYAGSGNSWYAYATYFAIMAISYVHLV